MLQKVIQFEFLTDAKAQQINITSFHVGITIKAMALQYYAMFIETQISFILLSKYSLA